MRKAHLILILGTLLFTLIHSEIIAIQNNNITKQHVDPPLLTGNFSNNSIDQHAHDNDTNSAHYTVTNLTHLGTETRNSSDETGPHDSSVNSTSDQHDDGTEQSHPTVGGNVPNPNIHVSDQYDFIFSPNIVSNQPRQQILSANSQAAQYISQNNSPRPLIQLNRRR